MSTIYFISHPEVHIDRNVSVPQWDLSVEGLRRLEVLLQQPWIAELGAVFSSNERKAQTAAQRIAGHCGFEVQYVEELGEMDRSATGMLEPQEFNQVVNAFFSQPYESVRGWERAVDAQRRIVAAVEDIIERVPPGLDVAIVSHGGVGTLLLTHLKGAAINRAEDQPGQGHYFAFDRDTRELLHGWRAIDALGSSR